MWQNNDIQKKSEKLKFKSINNGKLEVPSEKVRSAK